MLLKCGIMDSNIIFYFTKKYNIFNLLWVIIFDHDKFYNSKQKRLIRI